MIEYRFHCTTIGVSCQEKMFQRADIRENLFVIRLGIENKSTKFRKALEKLKKICYNISVQRQAVKRGHTSRGSSGALNLKSAIAGVDSFFEEGVLTN